MMQRIRKLMNNDEGFTLIELLIVIVILGILAAIVVFAVSGITNRGTLAACKADASSIATAAEAYYAQNSSYPATIGPMVSGGFLHASASITSSTGTTDAGNGYTITYAPGSGTSPSTVTSNLASCP